MPKETKKREINRCGTAGCTERVDGKENFFCEKHTYQRYHHVFFRGRQPVSIGDERTLGDLL